VTDTVDGPLPLARRRLADAVHALADPQPQWIGGACRWQGSVYARLRTELAGGRVVRRSSAHMSRLPCHTGILVWVCEVDAVVAGWEPHGKTTVDRLHQLAGRGFRPQDCELLDEYCSTIERWVLAAAELLDAAPKVFLPQPCPRCDSRFAYRTDGAGERVSVRALRVSEDGWAAPRFPDCGFRVHLRCEL
jgi:hypothetical protein